ncbi:MAG TPA: histidine kinase dimerization/phospho-acceptor domain-containing protein, partial [Acidimicrobiia bacterium]|nr:histidine kinase dimerization/phospho-acceptor domain-containing protein [Acidimicrobiia bacterium]
MPFGVGLVGLLLTLGMFVALWNAADQGAEERLATQALTVVQSASDALSTVDARLVSLSGLFRASIAVTPVEFEQFTDDVGLEPGMAGIGYLLRIDSSQLEVTEALLAVETGSEVTAYEFDSEGHPAPVGSRREYHLVQHVSPRDEWGQLVGLDLGSISLIEPALTAAVESRQSAMTSLFDLPGQVDGDNFAMFRVVTSPSTDEPVAVAVAMMDFSDLIEANIPAGVAPYVQWSFAEMGDDLSGLSATTVELGHGGQAFAISVSAIPDSPFAADREGAFVALGLGLLASCLAVLSMLLIGQRIESAADLAGAQSMTEAKDRFIASISHELRTPLTSVLGFAEILRDGEELSAAERMAMMKAITEEATDLAHIIDDLLVAARG